MREIEIKLKARDLNEIERKLTMQGCELSAPIHQHDVVYSPQGKVSAWETPKEGDIVVRIRRQGDKAIFTLKQQRTHESDNTEIETEISDPEGMHRALLLLGCAPVVEVKKIRRKGKWKGYEICLDNVETLGAFVELEKLTDDDSDAAQVTEELFQAIEALGLLRSEQETRGYDTQIYRLEHELRK